MGKCCLTSELSRAACLGIVMCWHLCSVPDLSNLGNTVFWQFAGQLWLLNADVCCSVSHLLLFK